jgi:hypothetical protein
MKWIWVILALVLAGCAGDDPLESRRGTLQLFLTDQPADVKQVWVTIAQIEVHQTGGAWIPVSAAADTIDLLTLRNRVILLESAPLEEGKYTGIRFSISEGHLIDANDSRCDLKIPSGKVQIPVNFEVESAAGTDIVLDFDAARSVHVTRTGNGRDCILRPVIHAVSVAGS